MIESWWDAHELEVVVGCVVLGVSAIAWFVAALVDLRRERAQQRKDGLR